MDTANNKSRIMADGIPRRQLVATKAGDISRSSGERLSAGTAKPLRHQRSCPPLGQRRFALARRTVPGGILKEQSAMAGFTCAVAAAACPRGRPRRDD